MADEANNNKEQESGSGGATAVNLTELVDELKNIEKGLSKSSKNIIRDIAITLYTNTNFSASVYSPIIIAQQCVQNAMILAKVLQDSNLLDN